MSKNNIKLILIFFLFSILLVSSYIVIENILFSNQAQNVALVNAIKKTKERTNVFNSFVSKSNNMLNAIKDFDKFKEYRKNQTIQVESLFLAFAETDQTIMQLRYLDKDGYEKIRVDRTDETSKPFLVKKENLQNKSQRYYFLNSKSQEPNKVWYSPLDLNIENGQIEIPYKPTLRAIMPLEKDGKFDGILIINLFMDNFLKKFINMPLYDSILINNRGDFLIHYDTNKNWGNYSFEKHNIYKEFPNDAKQILNNELYQNNQFVSRKINDQLIIILQLSKKYEKEQTKETNKRYLLVSILTIVFSMLLSIITVKILQNRVSILKDKLNLSLDRASHIAHLGFWKYNKIKDKLTWNKGIYEILEIDDIDQEITYNQFLSYIDQEDIPKIKEEYKNSIEDKREYFIKYKLKSAKNNIKYVEERAIHTFDKKGNHIKTEGSIYDVTKLTLLQQEQLDQQKMLYNQSKLAAMGEMIANISHQWRQPLSVISTGATGMKMQKEYNLLKDDFFYTTCDSINENAQYLSQTIEDFTNYIKGDSKPVRFDLKNDTDSFIKLVDSTIKKYNLNIILELEESIKVKGYPNELIQCFINIFNNAKDALITNVDESERYIFISQKVINNKVIIKFRDNGGGISESALPKIFEPYFTTKHQSQGTGLGLHMSYNLITKSMKGDIKAENVSFEFNNKRYIGAQFTITIPLEQH